MAESQSKGQIEEENRRLTQSHQELERRVQNLSDTMSYMKNRIARCFEGLDKALPALGDLRAEVVHEPAEHR